MSDAAFDFFRQQLMQLSRRVEQLEGKVEQLRSQAIDPRLLRPNHREFQQLEERVKGLEGNISVG